MRDRPPSMPLGVRLFLGYALLVLAVIGLSLRWVVDQAIEQPISLIGVVWMGLLAYTIFTITLVLQRKEAARGLAFGLASLTLPAIPLLALSALLPAAVVLTVMAIALFRALSTPAVRLYLSET